MDFLISHQLPLTPASSTHTFPHCAPMRHCTLLPTSAVLLWHIFAVLQHPQHLYMVRPQQSIVYPTFERIRSPVLNVLVCTLHFLDSQNRIRCSHLQVNCSILRTGNTLKREIKTDTSALPPGKRSYACHNKNSPWYVVCNYQKTQQEAQTNQNRNFLNFLSHLF